MKIISKKILCIGNDLLIAQLDKNGLYQKGFRLIHAPSGNDAIELIKIKPDSIDLIMIDIDMDDSIEIVLQIQKENNIPVLFLYSDNSLENIKKTEKINSYGYVIKNSPETVLSAAISTALRLYRSQKELENERINEKWLDADNLKGSEILFRHLVDNIGEGIAFVDPDENIIFANRSGEEIFGVQPGKLAGRNLSEFYEKEQFQRILEQTAQRRKGRRSVFDSDIILDNGQKKTILITATPRVQRSGEFSGTFAIFRDVSEHLYAIELLRQNEQRLSDMAKNVPGVVYQFRVRPDGSSYFSYISERATEMFGFPVESNSPEWNLGAQIPDEDRQSFLDSISSAITSRTPWGYEGQIICKDGKLKWFQGRALPTMVGDELVYNGILIDLTERKESELLLREYAEELKRSNAMKDKFFSILAHDLRSPFSGFMGITEDLASNLDSLSMEDIAEYARSLHSTSKKIYQLLTNLLEWSRVKTGKIELKPIVFNLFAEVTGIINLFSSAASNKEITINNLIDRDCFIYIDLNSLSTILRNLISNSIKFTPHGGLISISSVKSEDSIKVTVSDSGIGMEKEAIEKIFRIDSAHTTKGTHGEIGSGLGLALCKELVEINCGNIEVISHPGKGTEVSFIFAQPA